MRTAQGRSRAAFSLLELLAVVVIIGVLAALLAVALCGSQKTSRKIGCEGNLRQIGVGVAEFVADFHAYPLGVNQKGFSQGLYQDHGVDWYDALNRNCFQLPPLQVRNDGVILVPTSGIWHCPSGRRPAAWDQDSRWKAVLWVEYGYNENGLGTHDDANLGLGRVGDTHSGNRLNYRPTPDSGVVSPSDMIEAGDGILGWGSSYFEGSDEIGVASRAVGFQRFNDSQRVATRHNGGVNAVFCDAHVESPKAALLFNLTNSTSLARWNKDHQPHPELLY